jgi:hypothetical protein
MRRENADLRLVPFYAQKNNGWASWIRTSASRSQSPLPYRLAIAQRHKGYCIR